MSLLGRDDDRVALHLDVQLLGPVVLAVQRDLLGGTLGVTADSSLNDMVLISA